MGPSDFERLAPELDPGYLDGLRRQLRANLEWAKRREALRASGEYLPPIYVDVEHYRSVLEEFEGNEDAPVPAAPEPEPLDPFAGRTHGKISTYNAGCHCEPCTAANADAQRRKRARAEEERNRVQAGRARIGETLQERVGDVLRTEPWANACVFGRRIALAHEEKGQARTGYVRCLGARCPHCVAYWLERVVRAACKVWKDAPVYRARFTDDRDWTKRGKEIRDEFTGEGERSYLRVRVGLAEACVVYYPGELGVEGEEPVEDVGRELVETLLEARADVDGQHRTSGLRISVKREKTGWLCVRLPKWLTVREANAIVSRRLSRDLVPDHGDEVWSSHVYSYSVTGLSAAEARLAIETLREHIEARETDALTVLGGTA